MDTKFISKPETNQPNEFKTSTYQPNVFIDHILGLSPSFSSVNFARGAK